MDSFSSANPATNIFNGRIEDISFENVTVFVTISYSNCYTCSVIRQTIRLLVNNNTRILNENGRPVPTWLESDLGNRNGKVVALPSRDEIDLSVQEHLIVELYSK